MNANIFKIAAIALILAGCTSSNEEGETLPFTTIGKGILGGGEGISKNDVVIHTKEEWENLMTAMGSNKMNIFSETEIDFDNYQIIAVFDEVRNNGGWEIVVTKIKDYNEKIVITVKENAPRGSAVPCIMTQSYHIVKMHAIFKSIEFKHVK